MEFPSFYIKLFVLVCLVAESIQVPSIRIVSGTKAVAGQFPYQVSIRVSGKHICGGALISQNSVVTAAHCVVSIPEQFLTVQAGTVNLTATGTVVAVSKIIPHPDYNYDNDIAVLALSTKLDYSDVILPISLAVNEAPAGEEVTITGWGRVRDGGALPEILQYSRSLTVLSDEQCARVAGPVNKGIQCLSKVRNNGFCDGDDGGPAVHKGVLIGIASYYSDGCGSASPDGYSKISYYRKWLVANSF
ncbi:serine protease SP24D-like [Bactrocera neohumeralis]|uniref:serine protease SP24D-like n=1 Tax=Bactrocera neohumeralis TaxID=98809 RepID=UPI00216534EA|nr:serine protease SP24D-like [Bactrocera neohumeralis]